jgi:hypothetical protein
MYGIQNSSPINPKIIIMKTTIRYKKIKIYTAFALFGIFTLITFSCSKNRSDDPTPKASKQEFKVRS